MSKVGILLIEDHKLTCKTFSLLAEKHQFKIIAETSTLKEAYSLLKSEKPDVVILDLVIPGQDVLEFISQVKKNFPNIPIIACSSLREEYVVKQALEAGCFDYVFKPFNEQRFVESIKRAVA